ncbi:MAG: PLP-dependent aminotransferase family protein [Taibaiella sp.]|nr:PLP-dependent aminotransferase family protein [Taibaiella sp.]
MIDQNFAFETHITIDKSVALPVYRQIANSIITVIKGGLLKPGSKIPSSRQMAERLGLHRKTIVAAYEELITQGWIETIPRKSITVSTKLPEFKPKSFKEVEVVNSYQQKTTNFFLKVKQPFTAGGAAQHFQLVMNDGFPDARLAPIENLLKQYRALLRKSYAQHAFMLGGASGAYNLRTEIATYISKTRGINIAAENILITRGAQMAIFIAARMILKPGSTVVVGDPGYFMANNIFEHFGAKLIKVKVDEHGIDVDAIERICKKKRPDMLYIIPHHHHPTTMTLSAERRMRLLEIIRAYNLPVIEDDYDYDFHYSTAPILPLASADHKGYVVYTGSVTKSFASSVRIGYILAVKAFIDQASGIREMIDVRGDVLMEEALAGLYRNGDMQRHLNKTVKIYQERCDYFCTLLETELNGMVSFIKPTGGMAVWVTFAAGYPLTAIAKKAAKLGIFISDGSMYNTNTTNYNSVRIGFASMNIQEMHELVSVIKQCVHV